MNETMKPPKQHIYDNWMAITESDFVTLFVKTWFAFIATLREYYPSSGKPYYQASGDTPYISLYKTEFEENVSFMCRYMDFADSLQSVYSQGFRLTCDRYPRFLFQDFYRINESFKEQFAEDYSSAGGYGGQLRLSIRNIGNDTVKVELVNTDTTFQGKANCDYIVARCVVNYSLVMDGIVQHLETNNTSLTDTEISKLFYSNVFKLIEINLQHELETKQGKLPARGAVQIRNVFSIMGAFSARNIEKIRQQCMDPKVNINHKLLIQEPVDAFASDGRLSLSAKEEIQAELWFLSYAYRLRNALFHEIIDPLDASWQLLFKNAYLVLKQIVDASILRLKWIDLLVEMAPFIVEKDFYDSPPPSFPKEDYQLKAKMVNKNSIFKRFTETDAVVHVASELTYDGKNYDIECDVKWTDKMDKKTVKNVSMTERKD